MVLSHGEKEETLKSGIVPKKTANTDVFAFQNTLDLEITMHKFVSLFALVATLFALTGCGVVFGPPPQGGPFGGPVFGPTTLVV